jgi:hypothetical protein
VQAVEDVGIVQKALKRDEYACSSCGLTPRATVLKVVWLRVTNSARKRTLRNAITLCPECCVEPCGFRLPPSCFATSLTIEEIATQKWQREMYERLEKKKGVEAAKKVSSLLSQLDAHNKWTAGQRTSVQDFISDFGIEEVQKAIGIAASEAQLYTPDARFRYFCGICWNWRRGN